MTPEEAEQAVTQELLDGMIQANARGCCVDKISRWYANTFGDKADAVAEDAIEDYYAVSQAAFDLAVAWEIEFAEQAAFEAKMVVREARMLTDDELAARYEKAKSQVKRDGYSWYFKGKNRDEWECDEAKAAACLTRYGLSKWDFRIFHDAEVAAIESAGYDETAFDLLPTVDELENKTGTVSETPQLDAIENYYAVSTEAFDLAVDAERDNAFFAKPALERYKSARLGITHTVDKRGRHMWIGSFGTVSKAKVAELLSEYGLTVDEYLACEKIAEAEFNEKMNAYFKALYVEEFAADYAVTVEAQDIATNAEIEQAAKSESTITKFERPALPVLQKHLSEAKAELASLKRARDTIKKSYNENFSRENYNIAESRAFADELDERNAEINRQEEFVDWLENQVAKSAAELAEEYAVTVDAQDIATDAEIEQVAANHIAEQYKAARKLADKLIDAGKNYTLTIRANDAFSKACYGGDTLVGNYAGCQHLYKCGYVLILNNSWEIARGGKTIATGDGYENFHRFITCEFDVRERFAEISDTGSDDFIICGEHVYFQKGKFTCVESPKYHAELIAEAGIDGNKYCVYTLDENCKFSCVNFVTEEEFFKVMEQRGAFTDNEPEPPNAEIELANDDEPPVTAEDREEMNAAVQKFVHAIKGNYEQCRRAEQFKAQAPVVPLTGNITVDSGAKAFALVGEYFPAGLKFKCRTEDTNGADKFTFTDGGEMFLNATCTPDNRRIEYLEVINTDYSAGKRKPLSVLIKPPAHVDEEHFFGQETVTVKSPAEAVALIEHVAHGDSSFIASAIFPNCRLSLTNS